MNMELIMKKYKEKNMISIIVWLVSFCNSIKSIFSPSMEVACEIVKGSEMVQANSKLIQAGIKKFKIEMAFQERKDHRLTPPVMKIIVPKRYLSEVQELFVI